jgi:hypothetical protein
VGTGSPQKMRPLKDNQSKFPFRWADFELSDALMAKLAG